MEEKLDLKFIVEWDVLTWSRAIRFWENFLAENSEIPKNQGLELGARRGGLTYFFAHRFGSKMNCSDVEPIPDETRKKLADAGLNGLITYSIADAVSLPFPDQSFDFITFKSILGVVGSKNRVENIEKAISEIHRVLKPGGVLLFAENLQGSLLHRKARQWFVPWGKAWRYLSLAEMHRLLSVFSQYELHTTGFLAAFAPGNEVIKSILARVDAALPFIPTNWRYVGYGYALK